MFTHICIVTLPASESADTESENQCGDPKIETAPSEINYLKARNIDE
jgi:hypothetical protein